MLLVNQAVNRPKFSKDPIDPSCQYQSPSMDNSLLNDDTSFDLNGNGVINSLNGHPSGKYSLKEIATSNNNSIL